MHFKKKIFEFNLKFEKFWQIKIYFFHFSKYQNKSKL